VNVRLNGVPREIEDGITLDRLVAELGLQASVIAIEVNRAVIRRGAYGERALGPGDEVEIVTLVGGG
jgi:thiamine biosynthesis protein ThiS